MSLLNDMLNDLNSRAPRSSANLTLPPLNRRWMNMPVHLFFGFTTLVLLSLLTWFLTHTTPKPTPNTSRPRPSESVKSTNVTPLDISINFQEPSPPSLVSIIEPAPFFNFANIQETDDDWVQETLPIQKKMATLTPEEWHDEHLNQAMEAIEDGNTPRAIDLLTLILTQFPASIEARESLAALYLSQKELSLAYDVLDQGLTFEPHNFRLLTMKSRLLVEQGQHREALALLEQFKPDIQKEPDYYGVLAAIFETLGRTGEAGSLYQSLVHIEPSNGQYWLGYAMALENKHASQQAIEAYKRASQSENAQPAVRAYAETRLKTLQG